MRSRISIRHCVRPSVGPSVRRSHTSRFFEKWAEFEQSSIRSKKVGLSHSNDYLNTSTWAVRQNASVVRTLFDLLLFGEVWPFLSWALIFSPFTMNIIMNEWCIEIWKELVMEISPGKITCISSPDQSFSPWFERRRSGGPVRCKALRRWSRSVCLLFCDHWERER